MSDMPRFPHLGNGWTVCAEIWYAVRDPLAGHFTQVDYGVQLPVRTYSPLFRILGMAGRIALKCVYGYGTNSNEFYRSITSGAHCACAPLFHILVTVRRFVLKLCALLDTQYGLYTGPGISARAHVQ